LPGSPVPTAPVPIVRALVADGRRRLLLLRRANTGHGEGRWCLPGGKVDYGVAIEEAVRRELAEETGLELVSARLFFVQDSLPMGPGGMHCINLYFDCETSGALKLNRESSAHAWIGADDAASYDIAFRNDEAVRRFFSG
jgi:8-oxo-dGTP pyrophosphatase MutT (NUDIX family)